MHLAEGTLFINVATLLWAFDLVAPLDEAGQPILPSADYKDWRGPMPCTPKEFKVTCRARGPEVEAILSDSLDDVAL